MLTPPREIMAFDRDGARPGVLANLGRCSRVFFLFFDRLAQAGRSGLISLLGVFWIRPLVRVRSCLSRVQGLS